MILVILRRTAGKMFGRLLEAVDRKLVEQVIGVTSQVEGVREVTNMRLRFSGLAFWRRSRFGVDPDASVATGHDVGEQVAHELAHKLPLVLDAVVHVDPAGLEGCHDLTDHHLARMEGRDPADHS